MVDVAGTPNMFAGCETPAADNDTPNGFNAGAAVAAVGMVALVANAGGLDDVC